MSQFQTGNQITLLRNGAEYFPALEAAIHAAQHEIHLQAYIYEVDDIGKRIGSALMRAAKRGVAVHVLLDGFGSQNFPDDYLLTLNTAGVEVLFFRPKISPWTLKRNRLRRLHQKVAVMDGLLAFVGGINIIDDMNTQHGLSAPRLDYAVQVSGRMVADIHTRISRLWRHTAWLYLRSSGVKHLSVTPKPVGMMRGAFVVRDNVLHRRDIERAYLQAIQHAKKEITIANAYFLPGKRFRQALVDAAKRGVKVTLLLQGQKEYLWVYYASHAIYPMLLDAGIQIFEYQKSFMHSKVAVIDDLWATVGSSNIDPFSLLLSREANVVVNDQAFAESLKQDLVRTIRQGATHIGAEYWRKRSLLQRFITWMVYGMVRFVMGITGYSDKG